MEFRRKYMRIQDKDNSNTKTERKIIPIEKEDKTKLTIVISKN